MFEEFPLPILFAHRGDLTNAPENTLPAFQQAIRKGADGVELDAKLTSDGHVIVIHDTTVNRTTDGSGRVASMPLTEIRSLDAGKWFGEGFRGTKVPLLSEVFDVVGNIKLINIELTNYSTPRDRLVEAVCDLIRRHGNPDQILFSSFYASNLRRAAQILPQVPRGLLALPGWKGIWARSFGFMFGDYQALHPHLSDTFRPQIARAHRLNRRVHVWTANTPEQVNQLKEWGVDGIFTDDPGMAVVALGRSAS
jgi:glycerophosphoryl diester phosphodiesterase